MCSFLYLITHGTIGLISKYLCVQRVLISKLRDNTITCVFDRTSDFYSSDGVLQCEQESFKDFQYIVSTEEKITSRCVKILLP